MSQTNPFKTGCPKCGGTRGYLLHVRLFGNAVHRGEWDTPGGNEKVVHTEEFKGVADKKVKCVDCGRTTYVKTLRARE